MALLSRAGVTLAVLALPGCDITRAAAPFEYSEDNVSVYGVMEAGSDTVRVILSRFDSRVAASAQPFAPLSGARVRVVRGPDTTHLAEAPAGFSDCYRNPPPSGTQPAIRSGCYAARIPGGVRPRQQYQLSVLLPGGGTISGAALVPGAPALNSPAANARVEVPAAFSPGEAQRPGLVRVHWAPVENAGRIEASLSGAAVYRNGRVASGVSCRVTAFPGTSADLIRLDSVVLAVTAPDCTENGRPATWDSISARLLVTAYDTAYARYAAELAGGGTIRHPRASAGVSGAYGVFGGAASTERRLVLVPAGRR